MKLSILMLSLSICSLSCAEEEKPKLNFFTYEQPEGEKTVEVVFSADFECNDPSVQPHARLVGVAETLTQAARKSGHELSSFFSETEQPQELKDHMSVQDKSVRVRFILPEEEAEKGIDTILSILAEMPSEIGKIESAVHEETKESFIDSFATAEKTVNQISSDSLRKKLFEMIPVDSQNQFMVQNFPKATCQLIVGAPENINVEEKLNLLNKSWELQETEEKPVPKTIENASPGLVVDGKIYMDSPGWWNKRVNGVGVGIGLLLLSIILAAPSLGFSFIFVGIPAIFLLSHTYLADPAVIEQKRALIFQQGFPYAYSEQCVGVAITPYESRALFIKNIYDRHQVLITRITDFSAYNVLKSYNFNAREMKTFLYVDETDQLRAFQSNFQHSLNGLGQQIKDLKAELSSLLTPYRALRDNMVTSANYDYGNNPAVLQRELCLADHELDKKEINDEYYKGEINYDERKELLNELEEELKESLASLDFFIKQAEEQLERRLNEIGTQYELNVLTCKMSINYESRMKSLEKGEWDVLAYYSDQTAQYIMQTMGTRENAFADILDLRTRR